MRFLNNVLTVVVLGLSGTTPVAAAGLAEQFRAFVLGAEAHARPLEAGHQRLDAVAQGCLQCHDGSRASHVSTRAAGTPVPTRGAQTLNHPVGMLYDQTVSRHPQGYRPRAALHPQIQLVNGQVSCISCHQVKTSATPVVAQLEPGRENACTSTRELTVGKRDRELCLACHNK